MSICLVVSLHASNPACLFRTFTVELPDTPGAVGSFSAELPDNYFVLAA